MQSIQSRILTALILRPMTAHELGRMLHRAPSTVSDCLRGLRLGGKVKPCGVGQVQQWALPGGPGFVHAEERHKWSNVNQYAWPSARKSKRTHPWVQAGKVAADEAGR